MTFRSIVARLIRRKSPPPSAHADVAANWSELAQACIQAPANVAAHLALAGHFAARQRWLEAHACYRSARALGAPRSPDLETKFRCRGLFPAAPGTRSTFATSLFAFQRAERVAQRVRQLHGDRASILDVGGGAGPLALFLPDSDYVLAEPIVNGIDSCAARGLGRRFDVVVCCHVLEHIPESKKNDFLSDLTSLTNGHVILLGPSRGESRMPDVDQLFHRIGNLEWAAEHLHCGLPQIANIRAFADSTGCECSVQANGSLPTTYWMVWAFHYASLAQRSHELEEITSFYNREISPDPSSPELPNDYLIELDVAAHLARSPAAGPSPRSSS
jgi:hypothetical protein